VAVLGTAVMLGPIGLLAVLAHRHCLVEGTYEVVLETVLVQVYYVVLSGEERSEGNCVVSNSLRSVT